MPCLSALLLAGCASLPDVSDHQNNPADPAQPESPITQVSLVDGGLTEPEVSVPAQKTPAADPGMKDMPGMRMEAMPLALATKAVYTCPMHPEVHEDHPGKCPKCGMTLVVQKSGNAQ